MFIPLGDDTTQRRLRPYVNYALIAANILVFVFLQGLGSNAAFTYAFSTVPAEIASGEDLVTAGRVLHDELTGDALRIPGLQPTPIPVWGTLITSMFMHGGLAHLGGNMLYLWIFGDDIEDHLGHGRYLAFYLVCGVLAALAHVVATFVLGQNPLIPSLGASGAISAVLGAYMLLHPRRSVRILVGWWILAVPALVAIGMWFVFQLVAGVGMLGRGAQSGGVAYAAHVGGFVAGLLLIKVFAIGVRHEEPRPRRPSRASAESWRPSWYA